MYDCLETIEYAERRKEREKSVAPSENIPKLEFVIRRSSTALSTDLTIAFSLSLSLSLSLSFSFSHYVRVCVCVCVCDLQSITLNFITMNECISMTSLTSCELLFFGVGTSMIGILFGID